MEEYKKIIIKLDNPLSKQELLALKNLNGFFNPNNFHIHSDDEKITVEIKAVDFQKFSLLSNTIEADFRLEEGNVLKNIYTEIEKIGSYGIRGGKRIYAGFNQERKVKGRYQKEVKRGKYYYAQKHRYIPVENDIPEKFVNRVMCMDSQYLLEKLPNNCIDLVFTSPPYNFGLDYEDSDDDHNWELYFNKLFRILDECIRVLKFGGRLIVNVQPLFSDYIPSHHMISQHLMKRKLIWKGEILWEKNNYNCKYTAWGSWKSPSNPYLKYTWEFIEIFCKGEMKKTGEKENIDITGDEFKEWVVAKWSIAPEKKMKSYGHPAMFPEKLAERILKLFSYKNDIILDPFNGAGTTTTVASKLGRRYLGIDTSEKYCEIAQQRLEHQLDLL